MCISMSGPVFNSKSMTFQGVCLLGIITSSDAFLIEIYPITYNFWFSERGFLVF